MLADFFAAISPPLTPAPLQPLPGYDLRARQPIAFVFFAFITRQSASADTLAIIFADALYADYAYARYFERTGWLAALFSAPRFRPPCRADIFAIISSRFRFRRQPIRHFIDDRDRAYFSLSPEGYFRRLYCRLPLG